MAHNTLVLAFLAVFSIATAAKTVSLSLSKRHPKRCLNLGSWFLDNGPFEAELGLVKYRPEPRIISDTSGIDISRTSFNGAFRIQRMAKRIKFSIKVPSKFRYSVTTAHAEIIDKFCKLGRRVLEINVNGQVQVVDVFKRGGCRTAVFVEFTNVKPRKSMINVMITARKGVAAIAGICIGRGRGSRPSRKPKPSRGPRPSHKLRPSASSSPLPSSSRNPLPSQSSMPAPTPSNSPKPPFVPSKCVQHGCMNFDGHADYKVVGNSMSYDEDRENCAIKRDSSAWLTIPSGAVVKKAVLFWSASGYMTKDATAYFNGAYVAASKTYRGGSGSYYFYGAEADVTHLVAGSGDYTVSRIWYDNRGILCHGNAAYAAWSLVVVYELRTLPKARINVCTDNFRFTFPAGTYSSYIDCIEGKVITAKARTTVVTFESDFYKGEHFYINGVYKGDNLFRGVTAPNLDIHDFDITTIVRTAITRITYTVKSYFVHSRFGPAIEGLFMPVRVVYHTLHH